MKLTDITEELLFCTTRILTETGSCGTGFFVNFNIDGNSVPVIITNKHVLQYKQDTNFSIILHFASADNEVAENITFNAKRSKWLFHPKFDLCCFPFNPILENIYNQTGRKTFYKFITEDLICDDDKLKSLTAFERVIMIGYPMGLYDTKNNLPLLRNGYTSSHPMLDFQEEGYGVVDMACINGSSGSPIFIFNDSAYRQKGTNGLNLGGRLLFLGILFAGPELPRDGEIVTVDNLGIRTVSRTNIPINLGYYIKSKEIMAFKDMLRSLISH